MQRHDSSDSVTRVTFWNAPMTSRRDSDEMTRFPFQIQE
jgi:hypothetical protein